MRAWGASSAGAKNPLDKACDPKAGRSDAAVAIAATRKDLLSSIDLAGRPADALDRLVCLDPAYQEAESLGFGATITGAVTQYGDDILEPDRGERIVDGKRIRPWTPKVVLPIRS